MIILLIKWTIQELDSSVISVSKLCCPVCWDVLELLRNEQGGTRAEFIVRGRHAVLSPVQLPIWLPIEMVKRMLQIYKQILVDKIKVLMSPNRVGGHSRINSLQSNPGLSNASSEETSSSAVEGYPEDAGMK